MMQVDYVEPSQNVVHLKLLPRVDYTRHRGALKSVQNVSRQLQWSGSFKCLHLFCSWAAGMFSGCLSIADLAAVMK